MTLSLCQGRSYSPHWMTGICSGRRGGLWTGTPTCEISQFFLVGWRVCSENLVGYFLENRQDLPHPQRGFEVQTEGKHCSRFWMLLCLTAVPASFPSFPLLLLLLPLLLLLLLVPLPPPPWTFPPDWDTGMGHTSRVYDVVIPRLWMKEETHSETVHRTHRVSVGMQLQKLLATSHWDGKR